MNRQKILFVVVALITAFLLFGLPFTVGFAAIAGFYALLGAPLFCVIALATLLQMYLVDEESLWQFLTVGGQAIVDDPASKITAEPLFLTIPLFTFAGYVLSEAKTPKRLVDLSQAMLGWLPGGFAVVAVATCAFFTAFTGASGVTIIALGGLLYPVLKSQKYPDGFNLGLLTTCGSLGLLFPPSLPLILYAVIATNSGRALSAGQVEVRELFIAGLMPGILLVLLMGARGVYMGWKQKLPTKAPALRPLLSSLFRASPELLIPVIILYLIFGGVCTASEVAGVIALYVIVIECLIYRDVKIRQLPRLIKHSMVLVGGITIILMMATAMTGVLVIREVPQQILGLIEGFFNSPLSFLLALNGFLLVVGCLMDIFSAILVVVPLLILPAARFGVDPYLLGIVFLTNLEIGYSTPPVGMNLFIASLRFNKPIWTLYRASLGFLLLLLIGLVVITYFPNMTLSWITHPPKELTVAMKADGPLVVSWPPVPHAIGYEVELLGVEEKLLEIQSDGEARSRLSVGRERMSILIAWSDVENSEKLVSLLDEAGFSAFLAADMAELEELIGARDWVCLLIDGEFPGIEDGEVLFDLPSDRETAIFALVGDTATDELWGYDVSPLLRGPGGSYALPQVVERLRKKARAIRLPGGEATHSFELAKAPEGLKAVRVRTVRGLGATMQDLVWGVRSEWKTRVLGAGEDAE